MPLFRPESIQDSLAVAWRGGNTYVLTWPGPGTRPIPDSFIRGYRASIADAQVTADWRGLYERLELVYRENPDQSYPLRVDRSLPRVRGWQ